MQECSVATTESTKCSVLEHNFQKNMSQLTLNTGKRGRGVASTSASAVTALSSSTDLASLFECPVCFDYVLPPILQCQSGHLVCSNCRPKLTCCPTCRGPLGNNNNIYLIIHITLNEPIISLSSFRQYSQSSDGESSEQCYVSLQIFHQWLHCFSGAHWKARPWGCLRIPSI